MPKGWSLPEIIARDDHRDNPDRFGDRIHLCLACLTMFLLAWPASPVDIGMWFVNGCMVVRAIFLRRMLGVYLLQAPAACFLAVVFWQGLTLFWTADLRSGIEEWGAWRTGLLMFSLYPVCHRAGLLILMLLLGFAIGSAVQAAAVAGIITGQSWLILWQPVAPGRISGWWPPVIGGAVLVGALGLHIGAIARARGNVLLIPIIGALISLAGIIATGTRGAWIGAGGLVTIAASAFLLSRIAPGRRLRFASGAAALAAVFATLAYFSARPAIDQRIIDARNELSRAVDSGEYHTNVGLRIKMVQWAWDAARTAPLTGVGAGDFRGYVLSQSTITPGEGADITQSQRNERAAVELFRDQGHGHSHNTFLHALATTGVPGAILLMFFLCTALYAGFARPGPPMLSNRSDPGVAEASPLLSRLESAYAASAPWGLLGMLMLIPFEVITISLQPAAITLACCALCPGWVRGREPVVTQPAPRG